MVSEELQNKAEKQAKPDWLKGSNRGFPIFSRLK
jgi:hypothetical protein